MVDGLPPLPHISHICSTCMAAKQTLERIPHHCKTRTTRSFELIHSDVWGPAQVPSLTGARYILTLTDDFSRYTWVFFSEVFSTFQHFYASIESQFQAKIVGLCTDRGEEFISHDFNHFCLSKGIRRQLTAAYTPHQNGVSERKNRTLLEAARSLCFGTKLPALLWEEMVRTGNYILNRCSTRALHLSTPFQRLYGLKPDVRHF